MIPAARTRVVAIAVVALIASAAAGWWAYGEHQKRELRKAIVALIVDTGTRLHAALSAAAAEGPEAVHQLDADTAAADRNLAQLKAKDAAREQALAAAADDYLLTSREILKRLANVQRYRLLVSESLQALLDHMRSGNRGSAWIQQAVKARERANKDYRDLSLATGALDGLLQSFPDSQKKIAPYVEPAILVESGGVDAARARALAIARQAAAEFAETRKLEAFR